MKTSRNLVGDSGKPQKTIKFKWRGLWTMEFLGGKMSAGGWESRVAVCSGSRKDRAWDRRGTPMRRSARVGGMPGPGAS